ncbi:MAG: hypothetical protein KIT58_20145 [Planctomycetota bacterium]|nr:hypothetical protein [Planctomycetota bacterium]
MATRAKLTDEDEDGIDGPHERAWRSVARTDARRAAKAAADEALGLELERVAAQLRRLQEGARAAAADRVHALRLEVLRLAHELAPDCVVRP